MFISLGTREDPILVNLDQVTQISPNGPNEVWIVFASKTQAQAFKGHFVTIEDMLYRLGVWCG